MIDSPIFLVDSDCSDTALPRLMMNGQPQIMWHHEIMWRHEFEYASQMPIGQTRTYLELVNSLLAQRKSAADKTLIRVSDANLHRQRGYLRAQNGLARVSFKLKRYGLGLFLGDLITRKLGSRRLNHTYRQKINQIQLSHLEKSW